MYSVLLVDDEIVIREGIRNHALWDASDFSLVGEAPDGEIALAMLQDIRPDILVTDIRMPFMDGLALVRQARESMPWLHVVILSGYDDFAYARQALALGVHDYLLKPVSGRELLGALEKVAAKIDAERRAQADMQALREQFTANRQYLKEKALEELFAPDLTEDALSQIIGRTRRMGVTLNANRYTTLLVRPVSGQDQAVRVTAQLRRLDGLGGGAYHFCACGGDAVMLVMGDGDEDLDERAYGLAQTIRHELARTLSVQAQISLGKTVRHLRELTVSYGQAREILRVTDARAQGQGGGKAILGIDDLPAEGGLSLAELDVLPIRQQLQFVTGADIETVLERYVASLGASALHSTMMIHYVYVEITLAASHIIKESGGDPVAVLPRHTEPRLMAAASMRAVMPLLREILDTAVGYRERHLQSPHDVMIRKAQAFIGAHYREPTVSLKDVAAHVALSTSHFCTVFSQETGTTFTEYLTRLRLAKAREMIRATSLRTSEIAYQVGYSDPHYFSYLFKRHTGASPRAYRQSGLEGGAPENNA